MDLAMILRLIGDHINEGGHPVLDEDSDEEEEEEEEESSEEEEAGRSSGSDESASGARSNRGAKRSGADSADEDNDSDDDSDDDEAGEGGDRRVKGKGRAGAGAGAGGGKGEGAKKARKAKKSKKDGGKVAIDVAIEQECSYNPVPWSKRQRRTSGNTMDMLRARQQGFNARRAMSAPLGRGYIPNSICRPLGPAQQKMFCGRFSTSGDVLLTASQDSVINLYDSQSVYQWSARPADPAVDYRKEFPDFHCHHSFSRSARSAAESKRAWEGAPQPIKTIRCLDIQWSVISTDFSPDEKWLAYSSWSPYVHLCNTRGDYELHEALDFRPKRGQFCLFSIQFSPDNTHILGGGSDNHVYLYSLERKERVARIDAHDDDVNAVTFADGGSQVVLSGGDDSVIKVWDLRSRDAAVGGLCGHQAGVTCITARGDGHHFISNGKDQTMKLWDIRKMLDPNDSKMVKAANIPHWDYRHGFRQPKKKKRISDASVKTFHGHKVLNTLIRCYFSPAHTTGQRFAMSGSSDGRVCIWDILTGEMVESLSWHSDNTRDVSWHPHLPLIASFSWDAAVGLWGYSGARDRGLWQC